MRRATGISLCLVGLGITIVGIALMIWNNAETWAGPAIVGGAFALLGVVIVATGWLVTRARQP